MDYRSGKCSQCGAEYKIPASFAHNQARCRKCNGVVHLEAVPGRAPDAPRRATAKGEAVKGEGERTAARAAEPEAAPRPAPAPAPKPATSAAPAPTPAPTQSPRPAAAAVPAPRTGAEPAGAKKRSKAGILVAVALVLAAIVLFLLRDKLFGDDAAPAVGAVPERSGEAG